MELRQGETVRIRRLGSTDEWCNCRVELVSPNGLSCGLSAGEDDGVLTLDGGIILGFFAVSWAKGVPVELFTRTQLEIEQRVM
jgi:hypothetical protein